MLKPSLLILALAFLLPSFPALAQSSYETPEYSGPTPKFDSQFDQYRSTRQEMRREAVRDLSPPRNDRGYDGALRQRDYKIQQELTRHERDVRRQNYND